MLHGGPGDLQLVGERADAIQVFLVAERLHAFMGTERESPLYYRVCQIIEARVSCVWITLPKNLAPPLLRKVDAFLKECSVAVGFQLTDS